MKVDHVSPLEEEFDNNMYPSVREMIQPLMSKEVLIQSNGFFEVVFEIYRDIETCKTSITKCLKSLSDFVWFRLGVGVRLGFRLGWLV